MADDKNLPTLKELDASIQKAKKKAAGETTNQSMGGVSLVARVSVELFAGMAVGGLFGYYLDKWLDTSPIFLIICFFFGIAGGMLNIYRMVK